jgi:hypothetical protein
MPVILPENSKYSVELTPIKSPPIPDSKGVKFDDIYHPAIFTDM